MRRLARAAIGLALGSASTVASTVTLAAADATKTFRSHEWGVTIRYPADLRIGTDFTPSYFDRGAWRISYAADTGPGTRIVAFALPTLKTSDAGGDSTAFAELRVGASRDPEVLRNCLTYGMNSGNNVETATRDIGGVRFTEVPDNGDAEMMKTFRTDDFRAVHAGACYAVDLVQFVGGTANKLASL